jgi:hypothetical protein
VSKRFTYSGLLLVIALLIAAGFIVAGSSYLPFEWVKAKIDSLTYDGTAEPFTKELFYQITIKLRLVGTGVALVGVVLYLWSPRIQRSISIISRSFVLFWREVSQRFTQLIRKEDKIHILAFLVIMVMAIFIRVLFLSRPMGYDEAWTFDAYASKPLLVGLSSYSGPNNHVFHTLLVHIAYFLLGCKPWIIRLPALLAGTLLVPASYMVARIFYNKYAAILTAALVTSSTPLVLYSTDARGYSLLCLFFLLILALAAYLKEHESSAAWLSFAILSALGFYTIPIFLYPFGIVVTWLFLSIAFEKGIRARRQALRSLVFSLVGVLVLTFALYTPVFVVSGVDSVMANRFVAALSWSSFLSSLPTFAASVWEEWNQHIPSVLKLMAVAGFSVSVLFYKRITPHRVPLILAAVVSLSLILIAHPVVRFTRVWTFLLPLYLAMAASGISYLFRAHVKKVSRRNSAFIMALVVLVLSWTSLNLIQSRRTYWELKWAPRDAEPITLFLRDYLKPGDLVVSRSHLDVPLAYYFHVHEVPLEYLGSNPDYSSRILVIVYKQSGQKPEDILRRDGVRLDGLTCPRPIKEFDSFTLYETRRGDLQEMNGVPGE